ncbi:MAG: beta-galactosidase [Kiritimatiellae bacterium]|nr:beta-galactosidase [Kiritimatiellia bacterium]
MVSSKPVPLGGKKVAPKSDQKMFKDRIILGAQYFRIVPPSDEWVHDFKRFREIGLDTVKIELIWNQIERRPGMYVWDEIDELMDKAHAQKLKVLATLPMETVPDYVVREADARVVIALGKEARRELPIQRYLGGVIRGCCCWDAPQLRKRMAFFVKAAVSRYRNHPALLCWDVFQEVDIPECACKNTTKLYQLWLKDKYRNIEALNRIFGEHYSSFKEIEPPYNMSFEGQAFLAYTRFMTDCLAGRIKWLYGLARSCDKKHPVIVHAHSGALCCMDDWEIAKQVDFYGTSMHELLYEAMHANQALFSKAVAHLEIMRSMSRADNYYWVSELSCGAAFGGPGTHRRLNEGELFFNLWTCLAHGAKGIYLWQFKPEGFFHWETPYAWGLTALNGAETFRIREFKLFQKVVRDHECLFASMRPVAGDSAVLYSPDSHTTCLAKGCFSYRAAFFGAVNLLWVNNIQFDIIRYAEEIKGYRIIYCPMPWLLGQAFISALIAYAENGGTVIADGGFGRYDDNNWLSRETPGGGLAARLGMVETDFTWLEEKAVFKLGNGKKMFGCQERGWLDAGKNKVLARYADNNAAVVECCCGLGKFIFTGTSVSSCYEKSTDVKTAAEWVKFCGFKPSLKIKPHGKVTGRIQCAGGVSVVFLFNHGFERVSASCRPGFGFKKAEVLCGENISVKHSREFGASLPPKGVTVVKLT